MKSPLSAVSPSFHSPLLRILLPLVAGIGAGELWHERVASWNTMLLFAAAGAWTACGILLTVRRFDTYRPTMLLLHLAIALSGCLLAMAERRENHHEWPSRPQTFCAVVTDVPRCTEKSWRTRLRLLDAPHRNRVVEVLLVGNDRPLRIGDGVLFHACLTPPALRRNPGEPDFATHLRRQGVSGGGVCFRRDWRVMKTAVVLTPREQALRLRERLVETYRSHFERHDAAVLSAMTLGHRSLLDAATRQLYTQTGTAHVLSLSGLHLAVLYGLYHRLVFAPLRRRGRRRAVAGALLGLGWIWGFGFLVGWPVSMVRAGLMFSVAQVLQLLSRPGRAFHGLMLAVLLMLVARPLWLFDVGFQLSCVAVTGILVLSPLVPRPAVLRSLPSRSEARVGRKTTAFGWRLLRMPGRWVFDLTVVSIAAQIATAPFVAYHFHLLPWSGWLGSLVVVPAAYLLLSGSLLFLFLPFGREWLAMGLSSVLQTMESALRLLASAPFSATWGWPSWRLTAAAYVVLFFVVWHLVHRRTISRRVLLLRSVSLALSGLVIIGVERGGEPAGESVLRVYHTSSSLTLHAIESTGRTWLISADSVETLRSLAATARNDWQRRGWSVHSLPLEGMTTPEGSDELNNVVRRISASAPTVAFAPRVLLMGGLRCAVVCERLSYAFPRKPLAVDVLVLGEGCVRSLDHILRFYRPHRLVLAASMSPFHRRRCKAEALKKELPLHDVEQEGMFEMSVNGADNR